MVVSTIGHKMAPENALELQSHVQNVIPEHFIQTAEGFLSCSKACKSSRFASDRVKGRSLVAFLHVKQHLESCYAASTLFVSDGFGLPFNVTRVLR